MLSSEKLLANGTKYFHCVGKKIHLRYSSYHVLTRTCSMTEDLSLRSSEPLRVSITQINPSFSHLSTIQSSILQDPSKFHTTTKNSRPSSDASLQQQQYYLSFSSLAAKTSRSTKPQPPSLRRLVSPFLLLCHPDKFALIPTSQKVNLKAVQTLNEWIDLCETYMQYTKPSNGDKTSAALPKNPSSQEFVVEFIVPSEADAKYDNSSSVGGAVKVVKRKKGEKGVLHSRRQVTLIFPFDEKYDHSLLSIEKNNKAKMHDIIQARARREILKLIRSAGLKPPTSYESEIEREDEEIIQRGMVDDDGAVKDSYYSSSTSEGIRFVNKLAKDLHGDGDTNNNIVGGRKGIPLFGRRRARAYWEKSQKKFAESINWKALREMEKREDEKFMENFMSIKMGGHEERKRKIIADLVARIRFVDHSNKINLYDNDCNMNDDGSIEQREDDGDTIFSEITQLDQLIAIRRISLLLQDNFDKFQFERSGENNLLFDSLLNYVLAFCMINCTKNNTHTHNNIVFEYRKGMGTSSHHLYK